MSRAVGHFGRRRFARFSATFFLIEGKGWPALPPSYPTMDLVVPILYLSLFELKYEHNTKVGLVWE
jgi:hypothetical protein